MDKTRLAPFCRNFNLIEDERLQRIFLNQLIVMEIEFNIAKDAIFTTVGYELRLGDRALLDVVILANRDIDKNFREIHLIRGRDMPIAHQQMPVVRERSSQP